MLPFTEVIENCANMIGALKVPCAEVEMINALLVIRGDLLKTVAAMRRQEEAVKAAADAKPPQENTAEAGSAEG